MGDIVAAILGNRLPRNVPHREIGVIVSVVEKKAFSRIMFFIIMTFSKLGIIGNFIPKKSTYQKPAINVIFKGKTFSSA